MGEMLTIRELAKRFDDSEQTVRRTLKKLIQAGRLKSDSDYRIESEDDPHTTGSISPFPPGSRMRRSRCRRNRGLGRRLISLRGQPDIKGISDEMPSATSDSPSGRAGTDIKTPAADIKQGHRDIKTRDADIKEDDWDPRGAVAWILKAKDDLIATLAGESEKKDKQIVVKDEQLKVAGASLLQAQHQIDELTEDRNHWKGQALGLPVGTDRAGAGGRTVTEVEAELEESEAADDDEPQAAVSAELAPEIKDVWAVSGLNLAEEQIVLGLFEVWRAVEHAVHNPTARTADRLNNVRGGLSELATGLPDDEWRGHAVALEKKLEALKASA